MEPLPTYINKNQISDNFDLKKELVNDIQNYLNATELEKLPYPDEGNSKESIRILESKGVLIRISQTHDQRTRLAFRINRMQLARSIIIDNGLKHLKVPRATMRSNYLIEQLLPHIPNRSLVSIAYYMQNHQHFNEAVANLTEFLLKVKLDDIIGNNGWLCCNWPHGVPRYDNVLIYDKLKNGKTTYKIGLIDLEELYEKKITAEDVFIAARNIILLFPYQYDLVINKCNNFFEFNKEELKELEVFKNSAIDSLINIYNRHGNFIIDNLKANKDPLFDFLQSPEAQHLFVKEIREQISSWDNISKVYHVASSKFILSENKLRPYEKWEAVITYLKVFGEDKEKYLDFCEKEIIYPFLEAVCQFMKEGLENTKDLIPFTESTMLSKRFIPIGLDFNKQRFSYQGENGNFNAFTISELTTKFDRTVIGSVHPDICGRIIKSQLETGPQYLKIRKLVFNLFMSRGLCAHVFNDESFATLLY